MIHVVFNIGFQGRTGRDGTVSHAPERNEFC